MLSLNLSKAPWTGASLLPLLAELLFQFIFQVSQRGAMEMDMMTRGSGGGMAGGVDE